MALIISYFRGTTTPTAGNEDLSAFSLYTLQNAPDREIKAGRRVLTYSGDDWAGDAAKATAIAVTLYVR